MKLGTRNILENMTDEDWKRFRYLKKQGLIFLAGTVLHLEQKVAWLRKRIIEIRNEQKSSG